MVEKNKLAKEHDGKVEGKAGITLDSPLMVLKSAPQHEVVTDNPVNAMWHLELVYGPHPRFTRPTYGIIFQSKLEGEYSKCILETDLVADKKLQQIADLNVFGDITVQEFELVKRYVKHLKRNGNFRRVANLQTLMEDATDVAESLQHFQKVAEVFRGDPEAFPKLSSDSYEKDVSLGVVLDTSRYRKVFGGTTVGFTTKALLNALGFDEGEQKTERFQEILRGWIANGYMLRPKTKDIRHQQAVKATQKDKSSDKFYIFPAERMCNHD